MLTSPRPPPPGGFWCEGWICPPPAPPPLPPRPRPAPPPPHPPPAPNPPRQRRTGMLSISRGFLKIEWAAGLRSECMELRRTLRAVLERSEQKSRKVYCSCKEVANGSLLPI